MNDPEFWAKMEIAWRAFLAANAADALAAKMRRDGRIPTAGPKP